MAPSKISTRSASASRKVLIEPIVGRLLELEGKILLRNVGERGACLIALGNDGIIARPEDLERGIGPEDAELVGAVEVLIDHIEKRGVGDGVEAVGDARRDVDPPVLTC